MQMNSERSVDPEVAIIRLLWDKKVLGHIVDTGDPATFMIVDESGEFRHYLTPKTAPFGLYCIKMQAVLEARQKAAQGYQGEIMDDELPRYIRNFQEGDDMPFDPDDYEAEGTGDMDNIGVLFSSDASDQRSMDLPEPSKNEFLREGERVAMGYVSSLMGRLFPSLRETEESHLPMRRVHVESDAEDLFISQPLNFNYGQDIRNRKSENSMKKDETVEIPVQKTYTEFLVVLKKELLSQFMQIGAQCLAQTQVETYIRKRAEAPLKPNKSHQVHQEYQKLASMCTTIDATAIELRTAVSNLTSKVQSMAKIGKECEWDLRVKKFSLDLEQSATRIEELLVLLYDYHLRLDDL